MKRLIVYVILALLLAIGIGWLVDNPGDVTVAWRGWRLETSFAVLVLFLLAILVAVIALLALWSKMRRGLPFSGPQRDARRLRRGLENLKRATLALAAGDAARAKSALGKAEDQLPDPLWAQLLSAQASLDLGEFEEARRHFKQMTEEEDSRILGLRGLFAVASLEHRETEALTLAAQIWALEPKSSWASEVYFQLLTRKGEWAQAEEILRHMGKFKIISPEEADRRRAVLAFAAAREADLSGKTDEARKEAARALKTDPGLVPAAVLAARLEARAGQPSRASKILVRSWKEAPHPELAGAYAKLVRDETPGEAYRRFKKLKEANPDHLLSRLVMARKALAVDHYEEVSAELAPLFETEYRSEAFALMGALEVKKGGPDAETRAAKWRAKATEERELPAWVCQDCGARADGWRTHCQSCGAFASLEWRVPEHGSPNQDDKRASTARSPFPPEVLPALVPISGGRSS